MVHQYTTDYQDRNNWMFCTFDSNLPVDVFYVYPTAYYNSPGEPAICPVTHGAMRQRARENVINKGSVFKAVGNYFVPYYRQISLEYLIDQKKNDIREFIAGPVTDVIQAFTYYMENFNNGRPFILAGHSQGSILISILLATSFKKHPEYNQSMVAAYIIGYGITQQYLENNPHLRFASGETDYGVIISYNTEAPGITAENITVPHGTIAINPISWKCDETEISSSLSLGSRIVRRDEEGHLIDILDKLHYADARIDMNRGVVICSTANPEDFRIIGGEKYFPLGNLHSGDYSLYYYDLRKNAQKRVNAYLAKKETLWKK
ncbi:DUF3089 domain-containing protein [Acetobacterium bakii]|uniref:DUF3089 domain-containing protein n=1 Tax=Acetobacterium bakii TaxID=52689 RepID=A0A0L6U197_9FIRM|nr:DUF3089 domain-containing protein [Acetobacterium bakii]KNZ42291.1 hypothetical protein AKG39_07185 [Acetobacterium bakii]